MTFDERTDIREYYRAVRDRERNEKFWRNVGIAACVLAIALLWVLERI